MSKMGFGKEIYAKVTRLISAKHPVVLAKYDESMKKIQENRAVQFLSIVNLSHWVGVVGVSVAAYTWRQKHAGAVDEDQKIIQKIVKEEVQKRMQECTADLLSFGNRLELLEEWRRAQARADDSLENRLHYWNLSAAQIISAYAYSRETMQMIEHICVCIYFVSKCQKLDIGHTKCSSAFLATYNHSNWCALSC